MMSAAFRSLSRRPFAAISAVGLSIPLCYASAVEVKTTLLTQESEPDAVQLPRRYDRESIGDYWSGRPVTVALRVGTIVGEISPLIWAYFRDFKFAAVDADVEGQRVTQREHAKNLRSALTRLGPAFIKAGQQLSIRPDLLPAAVLFELQKLCDDVEPVPDDVAMGVLMEDLGLDSMEQVHDLFHGIEIAASASLVRQNIPDSRRKSHTENVF